MEHVEDFLGRSRISGHSGNGEGIHVPSLQAVVATSKNPCSGVHIKKLKYFHAPEPHTCACVLMYVA